MQEELLDQVLREGLSSSDNGSPEAETQRFRKLLVVLFNSCVLKPPDKVQQTELERIHLTLSILARQITQRPELLTSLPASPDDLQPQTPFYTWLLSRLVIAATQTEEAEQRRPDLVDALCKAAVHILRTLAYDVSDGGDAYLRGPVRVAHTMREMVRYVQGEQSQSHMR